MYISGTTYSVNVTTLNLVDNTISSASLIVSGNSTLANTIISNITSANIISTNILSINNTITNSLITNLTTSSILVSGNSVLNNITAGIFNSISITSANISSLNFTSTNAVHTTISTGTLYVNSVNITPNPYDIVNQVSFAASNNVTNATLGSLQFPSTAVRYFHTYINCYVNSTTSSLFTTFNINGLQRTSGNWKLNIDYIGDNTGITFSIDSTGQLYYSSPNFTGWVGTTMNYRANTLTL